MMAMTQAGAQTQAYHAQFQSTFPFSAAVGGYPEHTHVSAMHGHPGFPLTGPPMTQTAQPVHAMGPAGQVNTAASFPAATAMNGAQALSMALAGRGGMGVSAPWGYTHREGKLVPICDNPYPKCLACSQCGCVGETKRKHVNGSCVWAACFALTLSLPGTCFQPFVTKTYKNVEFRCQDCDELLAIFRPGTNDDHHH